MSQPTDALTFEDGVSHQNESTATWRLPRALELCLILLIALELLVPWVTSNYGVDSGFHIQWIKDVTTLLASGVRIPRWVPDAYFGFGSPTFYFYPPLTYYLAAGISWATTLSNPTLLYQATGWLATVLSFFSALIFFRPIAKSRYQAKLAAALYAFGPFRLADLYSRSNLSTHTAYLFIPLVWYGAYCIFTQVRSRKFGIILLATATAALSYTSVPLLFVTAVCVVVAGIVVARQLTGRMILDGIIAMVLAAALTAMQTVTAIEFRHFSNVSDLFAVMPGYLLNLLPRGLGFPALFYVGLQAGALVLFAWVFVRQKHGRVSPDEQRIAKIGIVFLALVFFLELPVVSVWAWRHIPPLPLIQDPWRFYSLALLCASTMIAIAASRPMRTAIKWTVWTWTIASFLPMTLLLFGLHLHEHYTRPADYTVEYLTSFTPPQSAFMDVYLAHKSDPEILGLSEASDHMSVKHKGPTTQTVQLSLAAPHTLTFHRFYWPAWKLYRDGNQITTHPDAIGRAVATIPAGNATLTWQLETSTPERVARWISLCAALGIALFAGISWGRSAVSNRQQQRA